MPSGRQAVVVAGLAAALLALLAWWGTAVRDGHLGDRRLLDQPAGTPVTLSLRRVLAIEGPDRYRVGDATLAFTVVGDPAGLRIGEDVTVEGTVGDGVVVESVRHPAPGRDAKRGLGLLGLALAGGTVGVAFVPTRRGWRSRWPIS